MLNTNNQKPYFLFIVGTLLFFCASFIRYCITGSIKVDQNYLTGIPMIINVVMLIVGLGILGWTYYKIVFRHPGFDLEPLETRKLALILLTIATPMLPMLSNDVFSLFTWSDLVIRGINPYESGELLAESGFYSYVGDKYKSLACLYGPNNILLAATAIFLGGQKIVLSYIIFKIFFLLLGIAIIYMVFNLYHQFPAGKYNTLGLVILSPVFLIQGVGQGHTDLLGVFFFVIAMINMVKGRIIWSFIAIALAITAKISFAYLFPLPLLYFWWQNKNNFKAVLLYGIIGLIIVSGCLSLSYWPFATGGVWAPLAALEHLSSSRPSGTITDVIGEIGAAIYPSFQEKMNWPVLTSSKVMQLIWKPLIPMFKVFGVLLGFWTMTRILKIKSKQECFMFFAVLGAIMLTIFSQKFSSWYLMLITPLFLFTENKYWVKWLAVLGPITIATDFMHIPIRESVWFPVLVATPAFLCCCLFFWKFRQRYFPSIVNDK